MNETMSLADAIANFHFLRPWWLLALIPALWLCRSIWRRSAHGSAWQQAIDPDLLPYLLDRRPGRSQRAPLIALLLIWTASVLALAGPAWKQIPYPAQERQSALVVVLDQSLAMTVDDESPDRQTVARRKLLDILDMREEGQTGLVVYAGEAHVVTPLTEDNVTIRNLVPALSPDIMPAQGNNPAHGVELALELLRESRSGTGQIMLITNGVSAAQRERILSLMNEGPFVLSAIGVGTDEGGSIRGPDGEALRNESGRMLVSSLDRDGLMALTEATGGEYADLTLDSEDINRLLRNRVLPGEGEFAETMQEFDLWQDAGPWLLLLVLPFTALIFRRGWLLGLALTGGLALNLLAPTPVLAQSLDGLFRNPDQQGAQAFEAEEHEEAAGLFDSPDWRGTAHYRAGNYQAAAEAWAEADEDDPDTYYNLGNALARLEMYEEAIASYDAALSLDDEHEDAAQNKAIVEELLEQQQQEQEQESDEENEEENEEQQEQEEGEQEEEEEPQEQQQDEETPESEDRQEEPQEQQPDDDGSQDQEQELNLEETEDQESLEQWLRRIDDNPGELLQRKFQFEHRRRQIEARAAGREL